MKHGLHRNAIARRLWLGALLATTALSSIPALAQTPVGTFTPLGFVGTGTYAETYGFSSDGSTAVGQAQDSAGHYQAFRWTNGTMSGLGFLNSGTNLYSLATGVSADGSVVVGYSTYNSAPNQYEAFRWANGTMTGLGFLNGGGTNPYSHAMGVSADGSIVVGYSTYNPSSTLYEGFVWKNGTLSGTGFLFGGGNNPQSTAIAVSADNSTVVGYSTYNTASLAYQAFLLANGTLTPLGFVNGGGTTPNSQAFAVSANGSVVVGTSTDASNYTEAFRWTSATGMVGLGFINGGGSNPASSAAAVTPDGTTVVGQATDNVGRNQAVLWRSGTTVPLGFLGTVTPNSTSGATGVSADGSIVVGFSSPNGTTTFDVFRWTATNQMQSLNSLLTAAGVNLKGFTTLANPMSGQTPLISANGQFIAGTGTDVNGNAQPWIARYYLVTSTTNPTQPIAGITNQGAVANSVNLAGSVRGGLMAQQHGLAAPLFHDDGSLFATETSGDVFGSFGSLSGGVSGRKQITDAFSIAGGIAYVDETYSGAHISNMVLLAGSARYAYPLTDNTRLFGELGGFWSPSGTYQFNRVYANGAGIATGIGTTSGTQLYGFIRAGLAYRITPADELVLSGDLGAQRMSTDGYVETLNAGNPFNASLSSTTDSMDVVKLKLRWTHNFTPQIDASVWGAAAEGFNRGTTQVATVAGVGTFTPAIARSVGWAEFGARLGYQVTASTKISAFVNGVTGGSDIGTRAHFGAVVSVRF